MWDVGYFLKNNYSCETGLLATNEVESYVSQGDTPVTAMRHEPRPDCIAEEGDMEVEEHTHNFTKPTPVDAGGNM